MFFCLSNRGSISRRALSRWQSVSGIFLLHHRGISPAASREVFCPLSFLLFLYFRPPYASPALPVFPVSAVSPDAELCRLCFLFPLFFLPFSAMPPPGRAVPPPFSSVPLLGSSLLVRPSAPLSSFLVLRPSPALHPFPAPQLLFCRQKQQGGAENTAPPCKNVVVLLLRGSPLCPRARNRRRQGGGCR